MIRLLKIEWTKILYNKTFWILLALYSLILGAIFFGLQTFIDNVTTEISEEGSVKIPSFSIYLFPKIWHNLVYIAGFFKIFLAFLMIILITNEFSYKTIRQNIVTGVSRTQFLAGKMLIALLISLYAIIFLIVCGSILGFMNSSNIGFSSYFGTFEFVLAYLWEVFVYLTFAALIAFIVRKSGFSIFLLLVYLIIESIIVYRLPAQWKKIMPLEALSNLVDVPNTALMKLAGVNFREYIPINDLLVSAVWWLIFVAAIYLIMKKSDL